MDSPKYMIWNNKGGVGKTFLTYMLSVEYALAHPYEDVIVIDACPQSNVSEMILGGNGIGEENLSRYRENNLTIAGYIKDRYEKARSTKLGTEIQYFVKAHDANNKMPENLFLLPGDFALDICSAIINFLATAPERGAWKKSRLLLNDLIETFEQKKEIEPRKKVFFIDCNPSFANYTEMVALAANRIIIPCTADAASLRGIINSIKLIYGISLSSVDKPEENIFLMFNANATENGLNLPLIHSFVLNRSRAHFKSAAKAFQAHLDEIENLASSIKTKYSDVFLGSQDAKVVNIKDGNTLASIINHEGIPLRNLSPGKYVIYGQEAKANKTQIDPLLEDLDVLINQL